MKFIREICNFKVWSKGYRQCYKDQDPVPFDKATRRLTRRKTFIMEPKNDVLAEAETIENANESTTITPLQQKTTMFMILFSLYIALAGVIYNFDLSMI